MTWEEKKDPLLGKAKKHSKCRSEIQKESKTNINPMKNLKDIIGFKEYVELYSTKEGQELGGLLERYGKISTRTATDNQIYNAFEFIKSHIPNTINFYEYAIEEFKEENRDEEEIAGQREVVGKLKKVYKMFKEAKDKHGMVISIDSFMGLVHHGGENLIGRLWDNDDPDEYAEFEYLTEEWLDYLRDPLLYSKKSNTPVYKTHGEKSSIIQQPCSKCGKENAYKPFSIINGEIFCMDCKPIYQLFQTSKSQIEHILEQGKWDFDNSHFFKRDSFIGDETIHMKNDIVYGISRYEILENDDEKVLFISEIEVNPTMRRQGLGKRIIYDLIKKYYDKGITSIEGEAENQISLKFNKSIGLKEGEEGASGTIVTGDRNWMKTFISKMEK